MPIIKTMKQYFSQKAELKSWENEKNTKEEQRKKYYEKKHFTPEEIANAEKLGTRIIDIVDIMDNNSEGACQDVELATQPIPGLASLLGMAGGGGITFLKGKSIIKAQEVGYKEYREFYNKIIEKLPNEEDKKAFKDVVSNELKLNEKHINSLSFIDDLDEFGEKITKEGSKTLKSKLLEYSEKVGAHASFKKIFGLIKYPIVGFLAAFIGASIYATKLQVQSSRIARYQARKKLDDDKNFVIYNDEQINKAKEIAKNLPEQKEAKKHGYFSRISKLIKDNKAGKADSVKDNYNLKNLELTPDEAEKIKKQQQILNRSVAAINSKAEQYSENMETAANVIFGGSILGGAAVGGGISFILDKCFKTNEKIMNGIMKKLAANAAKPRANKMLSVVYEALQNPKVMKLAKGAGQRGAMAVIGGILTTIATGPIVLMLTKNASRAGRYSAKKELENDPRNFVYVDEKELSEHKDVKVKKEGFIDKFTAMFRIVPKSVAEVFEYKKYKKTHLKDKQQMAEALKQVEATPEQLKEAKKLKASLFNTFEEIDENSQVLSEDAETASDVAQQLMPLGLMATMAVPPIILINGILKGKIGPTAILKGVTSFLGNGTKVLNSKFFKKQVNHVADNFTDVLDKNYAKLLNESYAYRSMSKKLGENEKKLLEKVITKKALTGEEIETLTKVINGKNEYGYSLKYEFNSLLEHFGISKKIETGYLDTEAQKAETIKKFLTELNQESKLSGLKGNRFSIDLKEFQPMLNELKAGVESFPNDQGLRDGLKKLILSNIDELELEKMLGKTGLGSIAQAKLTGLLDNVLNNINKEDVMAILEKAQKLTDGKQDINIAETLANTLKSQPKILEILKKAGIQNLDGFENSKSMQDIVCKLIENNPEAVQKTQKTVGSLLDLTISGLNSPFAEAKLQEFIKTQKVLKGLSKEEAIKVSKDLLKIFNNLPASEISKIMTKIIKYQKENPEKFEILLKALTKDDGAGLQNLGKELLITPDIKKLMVSAAVSYTAINAFIGYLITSFFADIQLKAGRIGTMNAVNSLTEEAAAVKPTKDQPNQVSQPKQQPKSLLDSYLNKIPT